MKKVLIIGYFRPFFLYGSARVPGLAKYLHEFGWQPVILTPLDMKPPTDGRFRIVQTPYPGDILSLWRKIIRKFITVKKEESLTEKIKSMLKIRSTKSIIDRALTLYQEFFAYPDAEKKWHAPALHIARSLLQEENFDAIISVWPITAHLIAKNLKAEFNVPWVADFPDPWSENHDYPYGKFRKRLDRMLEIKTLKDADILTVASPSFVDKQKSLHRKKVMMISHGFDPDTMNIPPRPLTEKFTISYTGTIYRDDRQNPEKILKTLSDLIKSDLIDRDRVKLRFYGKYQTWLDELIAQNQLRNVAVQYGQIPRQESISRQQESQVLLLMGWENPKEKGFYPFKIFEYLAAQRPILITGGSDNEDIKRIVRQSRAGVAAKEVPEIKEILLKMYGDYLKNGAVPYRGQRREIKKYNSRETARKFTAVLDSVS